MKQEFLKHFPHTHFTIIALIIFLLLFFVLVLRVTVFRNQQVQDGVSRLPLEDDAKGVSHGQ